MNLADDDFTLFGLPQRYALDRASLDERRRELQARVHPDRFAADGATAQRLAMQWAVRVNEAYQRLKDPLARGAYLCRLRGVLAETERNATMPADFLMQQMSWREALDDAPGPAEVHALEDAVAEQERVMLAQLTELLDVKSDNAAAAEQVRALVFLARFRKDIERRLEALDTNR
jgi:molecular chaperone HscB